MVLTEVCSFPGRGRGLAAAKELKVGDCILDEEPIVFVPRVSVEIILLIALVASAWSFFGPGLEAWFMWILAAAFGYSIVWTCGEFCWVCVLVARLDSKNKQRYTNLESGFPSTAMPFVDTLMIWRCNNFPVDRGRGAVFANACLLNHSCAPNAFHHWDEHRRRMVVHCMKPIKKGEEVTISYVKPFAKTADRQQQLREKYRFTCSCLVCSASDAKREASDERRSRCGFLTEGAARRVITSNYQQSMGELEELLEVLDKEFGDPGYKGDPSMEMSEQLRRQNKKAEARTWASKAYKLLLPVKGASSMDVMKAKRAASQ
eukprot:TRINITY_DN105553_c0_g1_i1.p1 TRINITY_DN105553_c0_g1~~TRINITY_DN105553_c0_g1_i1.p1  ORF type:complete len:332 (+),score=60.96 TRINITY_DN105553_c0_g1_i1:43-996(+)